MGLFDLFEGSLSRDIKKSMDTIQGQTLAPEMTSAFQQSQMLSNQGMSQTAKSTYAQENARTMNALIRQSQGARGGMANIGAIAANMGIANSKLATMEDSIKRQNKMFGIQTGMQYGQEQNKLQTYKNEAKFNYLQNKQAQRNQMISGVMGLAGSLAGSFITAGGAAGSFSNLFNKAVTPKSIIG